MEPLADIQLVESLLGRELDAGESVQSDELLIYASALVRKRAGLTWTDESGDLTDLPDGIAQVTAGAVVRAIQNPTGAIYETTGPFAVSYGARAAERVFLTPSDKAIIDAAAAGNSIAFSIDPTSTDTTPAYLGGVDYSSW